MVEVGKVEDVEFEWGKKRGRGGKKNEIQFYESFTYDGVEYTLFDSVYVYKEGEPEPYIGKILKIWEHPDKTKKVKILWFFRPCEILNHMGPEETPENELFLASGEGVGLANVNQLEAIAGKCNVVCTSKDNRNPQPSDEELQKADFIFHRTFDVGNCMILDKIDEKIAGIEVKSIFNRAELQKSSDVQKLDSSKKEVDGNAASDERVISPKQNISTEDKYVKIYGNSVDTLAKGNADLKASLVKQKSFPSKEEVSGNTASDERLILAKQCISKEDKTVKTNGNSVSTSTKESADMKASLGKQKSLLGDEPASRAGKKFGEMTKSSDRRENTSGDKTISKSTVDSGRSQDEDGKVLVIEKKIEEKVHSNKDSGESDCRSSKKAKFDSSVKLSQGKNKNNVQKIILDSNCNDVNALVPAVTASEDKSKLSKDSHGTDKGPSKNLKGEKLTKLPNGKLPNASPSLSGNEGKKTDFQVMEVTRRPDVDRSKWFRGPPWEERVQKANEQGTLVLLQNLDPAYTSAEVEDIVWNGFKESCTAKMIQRTAISSPHSGQAVVIFKTRESAEKVIGKLDTGCLLLSNERPLVGSFGTSCLPGKQFTFFGHLGIDKPKVQMQRDMKQAVSTSHCSQPNTLEYDMAMEWCLLQERSDRTLKKLYEQQGGELRKLKAELKFK